MGYLQLSIVITVAITLIICLLYWQIAKLFRKVDIKSCFNQIVKIQRIAEITNYAYYASFFLLLALTFLYVIGVFNLLLEVFTFVIILAVIDSFFQIFRILTPEVMITLNHSIYLESRGFKGVPSFFDKYSEHISTIVSVTTVIIGIITVLQNFVWR